MHDLQALPVATLPTFRSGTEAENAVDLGFVWELCLQAEYDVDLLVETLADWLGASEGVRILDCACGSGFPALELIRRGYAVTCTDGSGAMLQRFRHNATAAGVRTRGWLRRWNELGDCYGPSFDVVLCRGSSLVYAGTWDADAPPDRDAMAVAIRNFVRCLRGGGRLYVDTTREEDLEAIGPQWTNHDPSAVGGHEVRLTERLVNDADNGLRTWSCWLEIDDRVHRFERRSHLLRHEELVTMMEDGGLCDVALVDVPGERYQVLTGTR